MTITEFLAARLNEDEALWGNAMYEDWRHPGFTWKRGLREVEAKRALLRGHGGVHRCDWGEHRGGDFEPCSMTRILAAVWRDHPDYDPAWAAGA